jgi:hypothetical protein
VPAAAFHAEMQSPAALLQRSQLAAHDMLRDLASDAGTVLVR